MNKLKSIKNNIMKVIITILYASIIFLSFITLTISCNNINNKKYYHNNKDTTMIAYVTLEHELSNTVDSLNYVIYEYEKLCDVMDIYLEDNKTLTIYCDSLKSSLFESNYKLERIKYYNDIAKNGNNIKYLRGWINRVLMN